MKNILVTIIVGSLSGFIGFFAAKNLDGLSKPKDHTSKPPQLQHEIKNVENWEDQQVTATSNFDTSYAPEVDKPDFVEAAKMSTSSVVFLTTLSEYEYRTGTMFDWFFDTGKSQRRGSGSGVIFSKDGYIVTNNHVIQDADKITVHWGKQSFEAKLVGRDPSTDIAVLKVDDNTFTPISLGNSSNVNVGEWVLAVGNPFNLTSTVTAGIVSAKGRNINILKDKFPIESFIQTDAAINPGNSGGALVNQNGQLIGINTAILSRTGSYAGYGFAVPVDIVKKVFNDIVQYGEVQKVFIGADFLDIDSDVVERLDLVNLDGVVIGNVRREGAVSKANLQEGDVIMAVNQKRIGNKADFEEYMANLYPGDKVMLKVYRNGKEFEESVTLLNREGGTGILRREIFYSDFLGAEFEIVSKVERDLLRIENGVKVIKIDRSGYFSQFDLAEGFIITAINKKSIITPEDLTNVLTKIRGRLEIFGINESGRKVYYSYYLR